MDELLRDVLDAHRGLEERSSVAKLAVQMSVVAGSGAGGAGRTSMRMRLWSSRLAIRTSPSGRSPRRIDTQCWTSIPSASSARASFPPFDARTTPWDAIQVAYFASAACWNYLTTPFVFTYPGVEAQEIEPWDEDGQRWRRLAVTFPKTNANHNADQVFYYDENFMQRRMDYSPDVTDNPLTAHYTHDPKSFDGFVFPTRRRVHLRDADGTANQSLAIITIDISGVTIGRA